MHKMWNFFFGGSGITKKFATALFWKRFNLFLTCFWIALVPIAIIFGWINSTAFVSALSLVALILASQSSWQASRVEHKADIRDPDMDVEDPKNK